MNGMYCPKCGFKNQEGARFCAQCGFQLTEVAGVLQKEVIHYAGFWRRFVALLIDAIFFLGVFSLSVIIFAVIYATIGVTMYIRGVYPIEIQEMFEALPTVASILIYFGLFILDWLYYTLFESSSKQATLGKMALGIKVTDLNGNRISFGRANARFWSKALSGLILFIGFIMAGFTKRKQALHDIIAKTLVVKK